MIFLNHLTLRLNSMFPTFNQKGFFFTLVPSHQTKIVFVLQSPEPGRFFPPLCFSRLLPPPLFKKEGVSLVLEGGDGGLHCVPSPSLPPPRLHLDLSSECGAFDIVVDIATPVGDFDNSFGGSTSSAICASLNLYHLTFV